MSYSKSPVSSNLENVIMVWLFVRMHNSGWIFTFYSISIIGVVIPGVYLSSTRGYSSSKDRIIRSFFDQTVPNPNEIHPVWFVDRVKRIELIVEFGEKIELF